MGGLLAGAASGAALALSGQPFLLAGGSDALASVFSPPLAGQVFAPVLLGMAVALYGVRLSRAARLARHGVLAVAVLALLGAGHRIVVDGARGTLRDTYWLVTVSEFSYDRAEGLAGSYAAEFGRVLLRLKPVGGEQRAGRIFLGFGPWRVNVEGLEAFWASSPR